jgi:hypothetical protein
MDPEKSSIVGKDIVPGTIVRDTALRKERLPSSKDKGGKNDEHVPEGASPIPGVSEWTENIFAEGDWRVSANAWAGFLLRVLLISGTLFSVYQYMMARQEMRVERTLQLVELWERSEYQEAQKSLKTRLASLNQKYSDLLGKSPSQTELAVYYEKVGLEAMNADGGDTPLPVFQEQFDRLVYFLNRVSFCVDGHLCDREIADAYFQDYANSFWRYFRGYVEKQRKGGAATYAAAIEKYVAGGPVATSGK